MRQVLIVSPHFPPVNAVDMHRVRVSLQHFAEFGWEPIVLAVDPRSVEGSIDPLLSQTIPSNVRVERASAWPVPVTRKVGLGDLGVRAFAQLNRAGNHLLRNERIDLTYFSTTVFTTMPLGRLWKRRHGCPFVLDMQDPWRIDHYRDRPKSERPPKYWLSERVHRNLESWTMAEVDGIIAVSEGYIRTLEERYPRLRTIPAKTLPFGAAMEDMEFVNAHPQPNRFFNANDGFLHGVYAGRGGVDMSLALQVLFGALKRGLELDPQRFARVRLHFVGTSYAPEGRAQKSIEPVAEKMGVAQYVSETPGRIPYFETLQLLRDADFLVVPGSDDPQYTASKIYPYIMARRPLLAVFREASSVCDVLHRTNAGFAVPLTSDVAESQRLAFTAWSDILNRIPFRPDTDWSEFQQYSAREMARQQCEIFDEVLDRRVRSPLPAEPQMVSSG